MKAEIISVGTELLLGQICNTNAQFLSANLAQIGVDVYFHTVVGDNPSRLRQTIENARHRSEIIIFTGGLGPTKDDLTKETIADLLGKRLIEDRVAMENIHNYFQQRRMKMTSNNPKQARVIETCEVFPNDHGMAPGMALKVEGVHYLLFPGPPRELHPMFQRYAVPYLQSLFQDQYVVHSKVVRFFGIGESLLEEKLIDIFDRQSNPTIALLASEAEVTARITAKAKDVKEAKRLIATLETEIKSRAGSFIYGYDDDSLASVVSDLARKKGLRLAAAESCTGGAISQLLTALPGASDVYAGGMVSYSAGAKINALGVPAEIIEQHGAVSEETARAMAERVCERFEAEVGVSVTGVAGPDPTENKPVGAVYIGLATCDGVEVFSERLSGSRSNIQLRAAKLALFYVYKWLKQF